MFCMPPRIIHLILITDIQDRFFIFLTGNPQSNCIIQRTMYAKTTIDICFYKWFVSTGKYVSRIYIWRFNRSAQLWSSLDAWESVVYINHFEELSLDDPDTSGRFGIDTTIKMNISYISTTLHTKIYFLHWRNHSKAITHDYKTSSVERALDMLFKFPEFIGIPTFVEQCSDQKLSNNVLQSNDNYV